MFMRPTLLVSIALLSGCTTTVTMTGKAYPPVEPSHVKLVFSEKPACQTEEIAFISTPLEWSQNVAMNAAREKAARVGADYLVIESVVKNGFNDASVSGLAYKCLDGQPGQG